MATSGEDPTRGHETVAGQRGPEEELISTGRLVVVRSAFTVFRHALAEALAIAADLVLLAALPVAAGARAALSVATCLTGVTTFSTTTTLARATALSVTAGLPRIAAGFAADRLIGAAFGLVIIMLVALVIVCRRGGGPGGRP
jgi:hypothetical protein